MPVDIGGHKAYDYVRIRYFQDGIPIPFDREHHALNKNDMLDQNSQPVQAFEFAKWAMELTSPYGALSFLLGDIRNFFCFDFAFLPGDQVAIHAVKNSTNGKIFNHNHEEIRDFMYQIVPIEKAVDVAELAIDRSKRVLDLHGIPYQEADLVHFPKTIKQRVEKCLV